MKSWQIVTALLLCLVLAGTTACNPFGGGEPEILSDAQHASLGGPRVLGP